MRRQSLIAIGIAILLGLLAVYLANIFLSVRERQIDDTPQGMTKVAVAAVPLDFGVSVTPEKVRFVALPNTSLPAGTFTTLAQLSPDGKPRVALRPLQVNQPLLAADLTGAGQMASIAATLPDGMRATSVRVNAVSGVAGFVKPNDTVDVLITRSVNAVQGSQQVTDVLLQNVRVIAMDQDAKGASDAPAVSSTATLQVSPVDAQKLVLGQQAGELSLILRKPGAQQDIAGVQTVSLNDLRFGNSPSTIHPVTGPPMTHVVTTHHVAPMHRPVARAAPRAPTEQVEVMRGTTASKYEVGGYVR